MKKFIFSILFLVSLTAQSESGTMLISLNKTSEVYEINTALNFLERTEIATGTCYLNARVDYMDYSFNPSAPYYGVAFVYVDYQCDEKLQAYLGEISSLTIDSDGQIVESEDREDLLFTQYSNPQVRY